MARKVLISFLGTGSLEDRNKREYRTANYHIDDKEYERSFVADALTEHYGINTIIMIGTVKSMWEELYLKFCEKNNIKPDEEYYTELGIICENANSKSVLELPQKEKIEEVLGNGSQIVLIKYGLNEEEVNYNIATILDVEKYLKNGDEVYVDITHSFRSLPLLLMNTLIYLQNVSKKNIKINYISYGMLEARYELGYVPVVNMNKLLEVNEWISGAYSFSEFGNAYKIAKLLGTIDRDASRRLQDFSNAKNLNNMRALQTSVDRLRGMKLENLPPIAKMTITPVVKDFIHAIGNFKSTSEFQYKLAKWHRDKHNYYAAYLTLVEAIVTYGCEICRFNDTSKIERDKIKGKLSSDDNNFKELSEIYCLLNENRNSLAHASEIPSSNDVIKRTLNEAIDRLGKILVK